jgi:3-oxoacyl-[acyl-carrier-protein] synthase I
MPDFKELQSNGLVESSARERVRGRPRGPARAPVDPLPVEPYHHPTCTQRPTAPLERSAQAVVRVAITGFGIVSVLGHSRKDIEHAFREGRSGLVSDPGRTARGFQSPYTGALPPLDPAAYLTRRERKPMGEPALYGGVATLLGLRDAGLERDALASDRCGVIVSNDSSSGAALEVADRVRRDGTTSLLGSGHVIRVMASSVATTLSVMLGTRGACWTVGAGCAGGTHALGQASRLVATGEQDRVMVVGAQELSWVTTASFDALDAFSSHEGRPDEASRPFDVARSGLVPSGGAAAIVLESLDGARARDARPLAEVLGYGYSSDGAHITSPMGDGAVRSMRAALRDAGVAPDEVEYVNAHAASTVVGDAHEARALAEVFGRGRGPAVSSTKSFTGHEFWMAGVSEAIYTILMMERGFVAPTRNLVAPDSACEGLDLVRSVRDTRPGICLSNSFGLGGTNASLVLGPAE